MLKYFHDKIVENPSFQYELQYDCEDQITNIFWLDAKMIIDYAHKRRKVVYNLEKWRMMERMEEQMWCMKSTMSLEVLLSS